MQQLPQQRQQLQPLQQQQQQYQHGGIPGLAEALTEALMPHAHTDEAWNLEEMVRRVQSYFTKATKKYEADERIHKRGTSVDAQAMVEEFVGTAMGSVAAGCYEKPWFTEADFSVSLLVCVLYAFKGASSKMFCRTLGPLLKRFVDDGIFRYREEERMQKVIWDALVMSGMTENFHKKAAKNLQAAFDEAHMTAPYGTSEAETPHLGAVQDFVKCWMTEFVNRSWEILASGINGGEEQLLSFLVNAFNYMTDPCRSILPAEMVVPLQPPLPSNWPFIEACARAVLSSEERAGKRSRIAWPR